MIVTFRGDVARKIPDVMVKFGVYQERLARSNIDDFDVNLSRFTIEKLQELRDVLATRCKGVRGVGVHTKDIDNWIKVVKGDDGKVRARTVRQFCELATVALRRTPGHRMYYRDPVHGVYLAGYVAEVEYKPEDRSHDRTIPERTIVGVYWREFGARRCVYLYFRHEECVNMTVAQALGAQGYLMETPELRAGYLAEFERHRELSAKIGLQCIGVGMGPNNVDGNTRRVNGNDWSPGAMNVRMDAPGVVNRMVIDVLREVPGSRRRDEEDEYMNSYFWDFRKPLPDEAEDPSGHVDPDGTVEVPDHLMLAVFHLGKHMRLRAHVSQITPYEYDTGLQAKIILGAEEREIIEMLMHNRTEFRDIVEGKSGGTIVLCAGRPGTGKTLTAEVFAEAESRPLYSVQASQLGVTPQDLETELLRVFARADRWNAILLIDEADVYVCERGTSLVQNAIVGVFLRVMEYFSGTIVLTTNRADLVDDAILSRCIAKIEYSTPTPDNQARIWRVLADSAGIEITDAVIAEAAAAFPALSGRDVKTLLKLSRCIASSRKCPIDLGVIRHAKRFKSTHTPDHHNEAPTGAGRAS